jgi:cysteine desulfurase family protein (TIGR01976 family)
MVLAMSQTFDVGTVRSRFPALARVENGHPAAYLDGPGGTQVPTSVIEAMSGLLGRGVSNLGGGYGASDEAVRVTAEARQAMARMLGASPEEVFFGQNMTSLTFAMSRAIAETWSEGDAIVLTSLDHDANFTPWVMAAERASVDVRVADFDTGTGLLDPQSVIQLIDDDVRLVAVCLAANSLGTVVDIAPIAEAAHAAGALIYVDAVHAGPHLAIDVNALGCDFLVASAYKFFGPHTGVMFGRTEHLAGLDAFKVRPAPSDPPGKWETGTQSFESLAGVTAAVEYLESIGIEAITDHERELGHRFLEGIEDMGHVRLHGVPAMDGRRVATFAIAVEGMHPDQVSRHMIESGIYVWSGHYYAVNAMTRLGVLDEGGLVRIGFCHYNTTDEVDRVLEVLAALGEG